MPSTHFAYPQVDAPFAAGSIPGSSTTQSAVQRSGSVGRSPEPSDDDDTAEGVFEDALVVHDLASDPASRRELGPGLVGDYPERILCEHRVVVDGGDRVGFASPLVQLPHRPAGRALSYGEQVGQGTTGYGRQVPGHGDFQVANLTVGRMLADVVHIVTVAGDRALGLGTGQTNLECGAPSHLGPLCRFDPTDL